MIVNQIQTSRVQHVQAKLRLSDQNLKKKLLTSFCPVVARSTLTKDKVVWTEQGTEGP